ncbi:ATP-binding cassette subfamily B protein [Pseudonocardia hierapolitana]|uniref:ATP-binding cassette subfamily B protein n=1 Tax=Pseudonocardia hierapolitana TaxID=1128676 RepID=A0A561T2V4_9PSEU|nr:ABC transporter ATP-binding protein [Pseudonocardia hierapolitana]TWF81437.1 ATP-binding cassette subfamily B protein [Pseudonocardia hierapolitana]
MTEPPPERASLSTLRRLAPYVRPHRWTLLGGGAAALGGTLAGLTIPLVTRAIVDGPIARGELGSLPWLVLGVLGLGALEAVLMFLRRRLVARPSTAVEAAMRTDLFAHLQRLPLAFHDGWPSGQLLSRATADLNTIRWFVAFSGIFLVVNVLTVLVGTGVLLWLSVWLGIVIAIIAGPLLVLTLLLERRFSVEARRAQDQAGDLATVVEESALGIRVLKSLGRGRRLTERFVADARGMRGTELLKIRLIAALWAVLVLLPEAAIAVVLGLGAWGVADGSLTIGTLVAAITVMTYLYWPIASIGWLLAEASNAAAATRRYWEVRDVEPAIVDPPDPQPLPHPVRGALELRGVRFRHPGGDREILRGVDLSVRPGETMALVGATGSGKTTLTALVTRLHDVTGGTVLLDGVDVRRLRLADLRAAVATAFEDPVLISASVRENVLLGSPGFSDDQVWEALRVASADGFVAALPWGLDTRIGEQGMSLSGGQRQRLALARAVVGHPPVLVLDDPLSALDVHTEAEVEAALRRVLGGVTALVVAHRPSTVQLADRVALLDGGRIAAVGTHTELLARVPEYRRLLASTDDDLEEVGA